MRQTENLKLNLIDPDDLIDINSINANFEKLDTANKSGGDGIPSGIVFYWYGNIDNIPEGYVLYDGTNGTPNLLDKFILGAGNSYAFKATGGEATHKLTIAEMPSHSHGITTVSQGTSSTGSGLLKTSYFPGSTSTGTAGSGTAHNNMPPYYALYPIMKAYNSNSYATTPEFGPA